MPVEALPSGAARSNLTAFLAWPRKSPLMPVTELRLTPGDRVWLVVKAHEVALLHLVLAATRPTVNQYVSNRAN